MQTSERLYGVNLSVAELVELQEVVGALDERENPWSQSVYAKLGTVIANAAHDVAALAGEDDAQKPPQREGDYL